MKAPVSSFGRSDSGAITGHIWHALSCVLCSVVMSIFPWPLAVAQTSMYHPFPDSNAVWGMISGSWMCPDVYIQDYYAGDTLIGLYSYKIIMQAATDTICDTPPGLGAGFLRDDTAAHKVYWRIPGMATDTLLYDFTLEVGDTLRGLYANTGLCADGVVTVHSVDSIMVGTNYRKRINFSWDPCFGPSIIEGIGSTTGLTFCTFMYKSFGTILTCFMVNGELLYTQPCGAPILAPCENLPLGMPAIVRSGEPDVAATPNPSTGLFYLGQATAQISVYNAQGKLLFQQHGNEVDLSTYPPGVYPAVVQTAKGNTAQRLVVVR